MSLKKEDLTLIEKYLDKSITDSEQKTFDQKVLSSKEFSNEVELRKAMIASLKMEDRLLIKQELKEVAKALGHQRYPGKSRKVFYAVAAVITILIVSTILILPSNKSLFDQYYFPLEGKSATRNISIEADNAYNQALQAYSLEKFQEAKDLLINIKDETVQDEVALYLANCYLGMEEPQHAIDILVLSNASTNEQIGIHASWFLSMAYLQNGEKGKAIVLLKKIAAKPGQYHKNAVSLLDQLSWSVF